MSAIFKNLIRGHEHDLKQRHVRSLAPLSNDEARSITGEEDESGEHGDN